MAITFTKSGNKVIVVDGSNTLSLDATLSIYKHPSQSGFIVISSTPDLDGKLENYFTFKYSDVTTPFVGTIDLLVKELGDNYFNSSASGGGGSFPSTANYFEQSNPDSNGYYQTITYKSGGALGTVVKTVTMTFDGSGNVLTYLEA